MFSTYIITNRPYGVLYVGQTDDLVGRMWEHENKVYKGFAAKYNCTSLVWHEDYDEREFAFLRERRIKAWKRAWKIELIEVENPKWNDLTAELGHSF